MKRIFPAGMIGLIVSLAAADSASAQAPCYGYSGTSARQYMSGCHHFGWRGGSMRFLGALHQHGPLFNYGPYYGYYPFEPYGPWNAQLQYTGPWPSDIGYGWRGFGHRLGCGCGQCRGLHLRGNHCDGCSWGSYATGTLRNVFHRLHPRCYRASCVGCGEL